MLPARLPALLAALGLAACASGVDSDASDPFDSDAAAPDARSLADSSTAPTDSAPPSTDAGVDVEVSHDADVPEHVSCTLPASGLPSDPGVVACGSATCTVSTQACCDSAFGGTSCQMLGKPCSFGGNASCDESADCPAGQVCCAVSEQYTQAACAPSCGATEAGVTVQLCHCNEECTGGASCTVQQCPGFGTMEACGALPGCQ